VRNIKDKENTTFLSAQEIQMAAHYQTLRPNFCAKARPNQVFGSKFVTVCITGNEQGQITSEGYQVTEQGMALIRDDCIVPTKGAANRAYLRHTSREKYIPDVHYTGKSDLGSVNTRLIARPVPVDYFYVQLPVTTPNEPSNMFNPINDKNRFPIENRFMLGQPQDVITFKAYLEQFNNDTFLEALSDFHLLCFVATMDLMLSPRELNPALVAIKSGNREALTTWLQNCEMWSVLRNMVQDTGPVHVAPAPEVKRAEAAPAKAPPKNTTIAGKVAADQWTCIMCTFKSAGSHAACDMCSMPKKLALGGKRD